MAKKGARRQDEAVAVGSWQQQCQSWPLYEALVSKDWEQGGSVTTAIVARESPRSGKIAAASFLIDLACLGVKRANLRLFGRSAEYASELRDPLGQKADFRAVSPDLVAKIVQTAEEYARQIGFAPPPEYFQARLVLGDADPARCTVSVWSGSPDGRPYYVAGEDDDARKIIAQLTRKLGADGFRYFAPNLQGL